MEKLMIFVVLVLGVIFSGCGSVVKDVELLKGFSERTPQSFVVQDVTISEGKESPYLPTRVVPVILKSYLEVELKRARLDVAEVESLAEGAVFSLDVFVLEYRDRGSFNRWFWGPYAGPDYLESEVRFKNHTTGENLGMMKVRSEYAWVGGMDDAVRYHAQKIVQVLDRIRRGEFKL